jgi:hypothetical protein
VRPTAEKVGEAAAIVNVTDRTRLPRVRAGEYPATPYYVVFSVAPSPVAPPRPTGVRCEVGVDAGGAGCDPRTRKARGGRS